MSGKLLSSNFSAVAGGQGALELAGILEVLAVSYGEAVGSVELFACAEVDVIVLCRIQDSIQTGLRRHIDRSRRKSYMLVGIVRRIHSQMLL